MPDTRVQLFRHSRPLVAPALGEACLALIRNDAVMNLLLADSAGWHEGGLLLEQVAWCCVHTDTSTTQRLTAVHLHRGTDSLWRATDRRSGKMIRQPSMVPYHVIFIEDEQRARLQAALLTEDDEMVFTTAQQHFGTLPGFDFGVGVLISPPGYATASVGTPDDFLPE
ncbi:MAG TPA: hypothetical protein VHX44_00530 [Planctomycetota bacterium]|nr:hypothetical protein [Planctomycetota bacterium]